MEMLMERVTLRDSAAFAELYDRSSARMYGLALKILSNQAAAEDAVQDAYLKAWETAHTFDSQRGRALTWLLTICHRRCVDYVRHEQALKKREQANPESVVEHDFAEDICSRMEAEPIRASLQALPKAQQQALHLVYFSGLAPKDAAEALAIPVPTLKTRLRDGLKRLRKDLS